MADLKSVFIGLGILMFARASVVCGPGQVLDRKTNTCLPCEPGEYLVKIKNKAYCCPKDHMKDNGNRKCRIVSDKQETILPKSLDEKETLEVEELDLSSEKNNSPESGDERRTVEVKGFTDGIEEKRSLVAEVPVYISLFLILVLGIVVCCSFVCS